MKTPSSYRLCDGVSEVILVFMVIFYPWAFGTTEMWSVWIMNGSAYALGLLLLVKWGIRWRTGYQPPRWVGRAGALEDGIWAWVHGALTWSLAFFSVWALVYALASAWNARVGFEGEGDNRVRIYHDSVAWLPHSYDEGASWLGFWCFLGMAMVFWATRDLLLAKSTLERQSAKESGGDGGKVRGFLPHRTERLMWILTLNGGWLALVSILQRLDGTEKLLWVMDRLGNYPAEYSFGPFGYRGNAAQYFNLLWPSCLAFWWLQRRQSVPVEGAQGGGLHPAGPHLLLLSSVVLTALSPILSGDTPAAWLSMTILPLAFAVLLRQGASRRGLAEAMLIFSMLLGTGGYFAWKPVTDRLPIPPGMAEAKLVPSRAELNQTSLRMILEHGAFGVGPYAYRAVYEEMRPPQGAVFAFAHNDWLQLVAEWGWFGCIPLGCGLILVFLFAGLTGTGTGAFLGSTLLGMGGVLAHAVVDFPFQVQSILFVFVLLAAIVTSLPGRQQEPEGV